MRKTRRLVLACILCLMCFGLFGCSDGDASNEAVVKVDKDGNEWIEKDGEVVEVLYSADEPSGQPEGEKRSQAWITFDEMMNAELCNLFVARDDAFLCLEGDYISEGGYEEHCAEAMMWSEDGGHGDYQAFRYLGPSEENAEALEYCPEGTKLFAFEQDDQIYSTGYTGSLFFYEVAVEGFTNWDANHNNLLHFEEIDGVDMNEVEDFHGAVDEIFASHGITQDEEYNYVASEVTSVIAGYFEGTDWVEEEIVFDSPYCGCPVPLGSMAQSDPLAIEPQKTKDGYFVYDLSTLKPGEYMMELAMGSGIYHRYRVSVE